MKTIKKEKNLIKQIIKGFLLLHWGYTVGLLVKYGSKIDIAGYITEIVIILETLILTILWIGIKRKEKKEGNNK